MHSDVPSQLPLHSAFNLGHTVSNFYVGQVRHVQRVVWRGFVSKQGCDQNVLTGCAEGRPVVYAL